MANVSGSSSPSSPTSQLRKRMDELERLLASALTITQRMSTTLRPPDAGPSSRTTNPFFILHRAHWSALVEICSLLLHQIQQMIARLMMLLSRHLYALRSAIEEAEECFQQCIPPTFPSSSLTANYFRDLNKWMAEFALQYALHGPDLVLSQHLDPILSTFVSFQHAFVDCDVHGFSERVLRRSKAMYRSDKFPDDDAASAEDFFTQVHRKCAGQGRLVYGAKVLSSEHSDAVGNFAKLLAGRVRPTCTEGGGDVANRSSAAGLPESLWADESQIHCKGVVGRGGFGVVSEVEWMGHSSFVIKEFFGCVDLQSSDLFHKEARIQADIAHHPNLLPVICCTQNPKLRKLGLVMERMDTDLHSLMSTKNIVAKLGRGERVHIKFQIDLMLQIAKGMEYLHRHNIIHRDLKSANILLKFLPQHKLAPRYHVKIADFGNSKTVTSSADVSHTPGIGTTVWRAPEVMQHEDDGNITSAFAHYTKPADVYSFAMVCYEIVTGRTPFHGDELNIRVRVKRGERPLFSVEDRRHIPLAFIDLIEHCWHRDPQERPKFSQICRLLRFLSVSCSGEADDVWHTRLSTELSTHWKHLDDLLQSEAYHGVPHQVFIPLELYFYDRTSRRDQNISKKFNDYLQSLKSLVHQ